MTPAILFMVFNRPDTTAQVMAAIREARPSRLYIAADGPRDRPGEAERCRQALQIATAVDWPCEVRTLLREENLGCGRACSGAVSWFFENEEEGIILEDDTVPSQSFFRYCAELLERYRNAERVMFISGVNFQREVRVTTDSYYFSRYNHLWGWATWRRGWAIYDREMLHWPQFRDSGGLKKWADGSREFVKNWKATFDNMAAGNVDTWCYPLLFAAWLHGGLTCLPVRNLVTNIGFGEDATHTRDANTWYAGLPAEELEFPLKHPSSIVRNIKADRRADRLHFGIPPDPTLWQRVRSGLKTRFKWVFARA